MATYSEHAQRMLDQQSGAELDRRARSRETTLEAYRLSSLRAFHDELSRCDWSGVASDDFSVHNAAMKQIEEHRSRAFMLGPAHQEMFRGFDNYWSGLNHWWGSRAEYDATHELPRCP